jgi:hypothetical protein
VLDRYDEASGYFTQAAAFNERANAKLFAARTNLSWATMLAERKASGISRKLGACSPRPAPPPRPTGYGNVERRAAVILQDVS